jgi:TonB family protein
MFSQLQTANRKRLRVALGASLLIHCAVLGLLMRRPAPRFVSPVFLMAGNGGHAYQTMYLDAAGTRKAPARPAPKPPAPKKHLTLPSPEPAEKQEAAAAAPAARVGSPMGTSLYGSPTGHDVRPALPVVGPHPSVAREELPPGVQGDVIIEITIDTQGNIIGTKFVKTFGYGIDERVLATLQKWHFTPATQDGVAIPSQQYVYFHFPG